MPPLPESCSQLRIELGSLCWEGGLHLLPGRVVPEGAQGMDGQAATHHAVGNKFIGFCFFPGCCVGPWQVPWWC